MGKYAGKYPIRKFFGQRKFDGKVYSTVVNGLTKAEAQKEAERWRKNGHRARIVYRKSWGGWSVLRRLGRRD